MKHASNNGGVYKSHLKAQNLSYDTDAFPGSTFISNNSNSDFKKWLEKS